MGQNSSAINVAGTSTLIVNPVWIQVASYVKPASYGSWVLMHTDTLYINTPGNKIVTRLTVPAGRGNYWAAGFMVRVGDPGGQWSQWFWEAATPYMTLSGNNSAPYGFCLT